MVPDTSLSIREGAIAAWPGAWQGANLRSIVSGLGIDVDAPWRTLSKKDRDWLLFTEEQPKVLVQPERDRIDHGYYGLFWSARAHVHHVLATSKSQMMRDKAMRFVRSAACSVCLGTGLQAESLAVTFRGLSIAADQRRCPSPSWWSCCARWPSSPRQLLRPPRPTRARRPRSRCACAPTSWPGSRCCSTSGWATSRWDAAPPRSRPERRSGCGSPPSCAPALRGRLRPRRAVGGAAPGRRRAAARRARARSRARATRCSSSSTISTSCAAPTGSSTSVRKPASAAARWSTPDRSPASSTSRGRSPAITSSAGPIRSTAPSVRRTVGCTCAASAGTTSTISRSTSRCAC